MMALGLFGMFLLGIGGSTIFPAVAAGMRQAINLAIPFEVPPIVDLVRMRYWQEIAPEQYRHLCRRHGFKEEYAEAFYHDSQALFPVYELISGWRRGIVSDDEMTIEAERLGWIGERLEKIKSISLFYPPPQDLIRWQAKEVYEEDAITKYGLKDEIDRIERQPFYKGGMDDEQIENYWMAHWQHPPWQQIREMLFRTDFTEADMKEWFRLVEIPPYWRDLFIRISYRTLTRVDIRRMHKIGVFTDEDLPAVYAELGWNERDTKRMADFTIQYNMARPTTVEEGYRDLTRAQIIEGYREGLYTRTEASERLQLLAYDTDDADFILLLEDIELARKAIKTQLEYLEHAMVSGKLTDNEVTEALTIMQIPATQQEVLLADWQRAKKRQVSSPTKEDLSRWFLGGYVDQTDYSLEMRRKGYGERHIKIYVEELLHQIQEKA